MENGMDNLKVMQELAKILQGDHAGWSGDRIENAECFLRSVKNDFPEHVAILVRDIEANITDFSEETGLSLDRIKWAARRLTG
jgi:hypothetical protein